jgi:uncharacterized protein YsxB (DUF464 family)
MRDSRSMSRMAKGLESQVEHDSDLACFSFTFAVPGMVAAIVRHFKSLSTMQRDGGMMHTFLEEANNERMHLLTFVRMKDPGMLFR